MKTRNMILAFWACLVVGIRAIVPTWTPEDREWEAKQVALWEDSLSKAGELSASDKFEALALGLRNMGYRATVSGHSLAVDQIYQKLQREFISIPGHATYYRDKINALKEQLLAGDLSLEDWDERKSPYFKVLGHLPSEEAVEVLCGFAGDDFATGGFRSSKNAHIPGLKDWKFTDYAVDFTVCLPAMNALRSLQIENGPSVEGVDADKHTLFWRQWWQEVKAGKRKYRFKGSNVEHPVKPPPGTFREQRRPEKHPDSGPQAGNGKKPASFAPGSEMAARAPSPRWPFVVGFAAATLAAVFFLFKVTRRK